MTTVWKEINFFNKPESCDGVWSLATLQYSYIVASWSMIDRLWNVIVLLYVVVLLFVSMLVVDCSDSFEIFRWSKSVQSLCQILKL